MFLEEKDLPACAEDSRLMNEMDAETIMREVDRIPAKTSACVDDISPRLFKHLILKPSLCNILATIINFCFQSRMLSELWLEGCLRLVNKQKGAPSSPPRCHPKALNTLFYKLIMHIFLEKMGKKLRNTYQNVR